MTSDLARNGNAPAIMWFRRDLRVVDNPALSQAADGDGGVLALYILDEGAPGKWAAGGASRWWLHHSLESLARDLASRGSRLVLRRGPTADVLADVARASGARRVVCSRGHEPWARCLEDDCHARLAGQGVTLLRYRGSLLAEPDLVTTKTGQPYKVFTPFWKALAARDHRQPQGAPRHLHPPERQVRSDELADWSLLPRKPDWAGGLGSLWTPGEEGAQQQLDRFIEQRLAAYAEDRNRPDRAGTSRLSPHLHFGEISPAVCWQRARAYAAAHPPAQAGLEVFLKELAWREFSYHLLWHWPDLPDMPFRSAFAAFPWARDAPALKAWQRGLTGFPIVDAGMRELWTTGWMHNRVRMIVASFLVKDLLIPWQEGETWFWDTLVDADLANNAASWQWVAGCGADAAPYFRIFNPTKQGLTFDPKGTYVRQWVPEIARLPDAFIHAPETAPPDVLADAGIALGKTYPAPIVDHADARAAALAAYGAIKL